MIVSTKDLNDRVREFVDSNPEFSLRDGGSFALSFKGGKGSPKRGTLVEVGYPCTNQECKEDNPEHHTSFGTKGVRFRSRPLCVVCFNKSNGRNENSKYVRAEQESAFIYNLLDEYDNVIYVGSTSDPDSRLSGHKARFGPNVRMKIVRQVPTSVRYIEEERERVFQFDSGATLLSTR